MSGEVEGSRPQSRGVKIYVPFDAYIEMTLATQYGMITGEGPKTYSQLLLEGFECWKQQHPKADEYIKANKPILEKALKEGEKA